jgi:hypothetical protein
MTNIQTVNKKKLEAIEGFKAETIVKTLLNLHKKSLDSLFNHSFKGFKRYNKTMNDIIDNSNELEWDKVNQTYLFGHMNEQSFNKAKDLSIKLFKTQISNAILYLAMTTEKLSDIVLLSLLLPYDSYSDDLTCRLIDKELELSEIYLETIKEKPQIIEIAKENDLKTYEMYKEALEQYNKAIEFFNNLRDKANVNINNIKN